MTRRDYFIIFCLLLPFFITLPWALSTNSKLGDQRELTELVRDTLHLNNLEFGDGRHPVLYSVGTPWVQNRRGYVYIEVGPHASPPQTRVLNVPRCLVSRSWRTIYMPGTMPHVGSSFRLSSSTNLLRDVAMCTSGPGGSV